MLGSQMTDFRGHLSSICLSLLPSSFAGGPPFDFSLEAVKWLRGGRLGPCGAVSHCKHGSKGSLKKVENNLHSPRRGVVFCATGSLIRFRHVDAGGKGIGESRRPAPGCAGRDCIQNPRVLADEAAWKKHFIEKRDVIRHDPSDGTGRHRGGTRAEALPFDDQLYCSRGPLGNSGVCSPTFPSMCSAKPSANIVSSRAIRPSPV